MVSGRRRRSYAYSGLGDTPSSFVMARLLSFSAWSSTHFSGLVIESEFLCRAARAVQHDTIHLAARQAFARALADEVALNLGCQAEDGRVNEVRSLNGKIVKDSFVEFFEPFATLVVLYPP